jgi:polysaccharide biosynthesis/export protein
MSNKVIVSFSLLVALAAAGHGRAQASQTPKPAAPKTPQRQPAAQAPAPLPKGPDFVIPKTEVPKPPQQAPISPDRYVVGAQDTLSITVVGEPELTNKYRVDSDGSITLPYIGRQPAAGFTIADLQTKIATLLKEGYLQNPQVLIDVDQYKSRSVYVTGNVRSPGKVPMNGPTIMLIEALALAGSPSADASNQITVKHQRTGEVVTVNKKDLELGRAGYDIALEDGDVINVPAAQRFYISGMVRNTGYYVLDPGMTIEQAIALAGGLSERGSDRRVTVTRMIDGRSNEVRIELSDKVQANDVIKIPSRFF